MNDRFDAEGALADFTALCASVTLDASRFFFSRAINVPLFVARAPGRLDVMGGIADYSGSLVLELPTREGAFAAVQLGGPRGVHLLSVDPSTQAARYVELDPDFVHEATYDEARAYFAGDPATHWAAYVGGLLLVLRRELGVTLGRSVRILVASSVPEGKGVSSSAAVEVATLCAALATFGLRLEASEVAALAQKAENLVAGAPCGIMDQLTAAAGVEGRLLELLCQPAVLRGSVAVPPDLELFGLDSGVRHAVIGADYAAVRVAAFMGYRIIAEQLGFASRISNGLAGIEDPKLGGYLANLTPAELDEHRSALPVELSGASFLARYGATTDAVTRVDASKSYPVRAATEHPVLEHARVQRFRELLSRPASEVSALELGALMAAAHASYSACGLGSAATDEVVRLVAEEGSGALLGAKITGGGSGGTVAVLGRAGSLAAVERVQERYFASTGRRAHLFRGSSPGALAFGAYRLHFGAEGATSQLERIP
jgi:galactokinase